MRLISFFLLSCLLIFSSTSWARGGHGGGGHSYSHSSYRSPRSSYLRSGSTSSVVHVRGYRTKRGTYVRPHYRSRPDHSKLNNWSTRGNINPYTGKIGTKSH
ncbi:MAG: hypothetical protein PHY93_07160 [Bacteriovorax sp.]|nr:hypothetical protein [Bacteriovorax sp.]